MFPGRKMRQLRQKRDGLASLAMRMASFYSCELLDVWARCSDGNGNETSSHKNWNNKEKKAVVNSVWLKESY
jgi:hypothetical protein